MKKLILGILDSAVPRDAQEGKPVEDVARARMLVFLQLLLLTSSAVGWAFGIVYVYLFSTGMYKRIPMLLAGAFCGYLLSIWVYRRRGSRMASGNLLAFTQYITHISILLMLPYEIQLASLLYLLALPFLMTIVADYRSGIFWLVMVSLEPIFLNVFGQSNYGYYYLGNWIASSIGLFLAIYASQVYIKNFSNRLQLERNSFEFRARHDSLTALINRAEFDRRLEQSIEAYWRAGKKSVLVFLDLDKFKLINDGYGHPAGDEVLRAVARRLKRLVRDTDSVARLGGDEFAILFDDATLELVEPMINRIVSVISTPVAITGNRLAVGCSLGVVVCPDDGCTPKALEQRADEQMYAFKKRSG